MLPKVKQDTAFRESLIRAMDTVPTITALAKLYHISKQAMHAKIKLNGLALDWVNSKLRQSPWKTVYSHANQSRGNNPSRYKYIYWNTSTETWLVYPPIRTEDILHPTYTKAKVYCGSFKSEEEAKKALDLYLETGTTSLKRAGYFPKKVKIWGIK